MKVTKHHSLCRADKVLTMVRKTLAHLDTPSSVYVTVKAWSNCREQGYCLALYDYNYETPKQVVFAENRNSDDVVVIVGDMHNFDVSTNMPSDADFENNRTYYKIDEQAADYIANYIIDNVKTERVKP